MKMRLVRCFVTLFFVSSLNFLGAQSDVPLTLRAQFNGPYGYTIIGNTHNLSDAFTQTSCIMSTSSSAMLNLSTSQTIVAAYLYWSGVGDGTDNPIINFNGQALTSSSTSVGYPESNTFFSYFGAYADVTNLVINIGNGLYTFFGLDLNALILEYCFNVHKNHAGWSLVVIYEDLSLPNVQLNVYDGLNIVSVYFNGGVTNLTIDNLLVTDVSNAELAYVAWGGSEILCLDPSVPIAESISINGNVLSNALNPPNNPFNSTNSFTGSTTNWNMDIDTFGISSYINVGDTAATITLTSICYRTLQTLITSIISELPEATASINSVTGQEICENRDLTVNFQIQNFNANAALPDSTPVSIFANDSLLLTVFTTDSIAVGDSLLMSAMVNIPLDVPSPFVLKVIANHDGVNVGVVQESNPNNNEAEITVTFVDTIVPIFNLPDSLCFGTSFLLPTLSVNDVGGFWTPTFDNEWSNNYTFSPVGNNCAIEITHSIEIVPLTTPIFNFADSVCLNGALDFPAVSENNYAGSWLPVFDNQQTTTYTFTPDASGAAFGCPISTEKIVVVVPLTEPTFSIVDTVCLGVDVVLPTVSNNNFTGTWSAPFDNTQTQSYVFVTDSSSAFNFCAANVSQTIVVLPEVEPSFSFADAMCADVVFALPILSDNNISGTWSAVFNNQNTANYTFSPDAATPNFQNTSDGWGCAVEAQRLVTIVPRTTPTFTLPDSICVGAILELPTISNNNYQGAWSPAVNNQITTTYTFVPSEIAPQNGCPENTQATIIVDPFVDPVFISIDSICQNNQVELPTFSENGINGSWSPVFDNQSTTSYTFTPSDPGCISSAQMTVPVFPLITPIFSIIDSLCQNDEITLPTVSENNISGAWLPALNNQETTTYTFTPALYECAVPITHTIEVFPLITPEFSFFDTICSGGQVDFPSNSDNNIAGTWSPNLNNQETSTYTFQPAVFECAVSSEHTILVLPINETFDTIIVCQNELPVTWNGQILVQNTNTNAVLQDQFGCDSLANLNFQVLPIFQSSFSEQLCIYDLPLVWEGVNYVQTGSYMRTFAAQNGCDSVVTLNLTVFAAPDVSFSVQPWSGCLPLEISFVNNTIEENSTALWHFGNGQTSTQIAQTTANFTQAGCYNISLQITNQNGCTINQIQTDAVCIAPNPVAAFEPQTNPLALIDPTTILQNNSTNAAQFTWHFGDESGGSSVFSPQHTFPQKAGVYPVMLCIENQNACPDTTSRSIIIEQDAIVYVPNAFTPDGNKFNEVFLPIFPDYINVESYELSIFNRWGELLFVSQNPKIGWNGTYGGKMVQDGVFVYQIKYKEAEFVEVFEVVGSVVVVR